MAEDKQVLYDLRTTYSGPFLVESLYEEIDDWIKEKGYEKEPKKKMEHVTNEGKKIELFIEAFKHLDELHKGVISLRVLINNLREVELKKGRKKTKVQHGNVYINIDGWINSHIHGSFFQVKPLYYFIRAVIDNYIYSFWQDKYDGVVNGDGRDLFKRLRSFFNLQKVKHG